MSGKNFSGIQLNPIYADNVLYVATGDGSLVAINSLNGQKIWSIQSVKNISTRGIIFDNEEKSLWVPIAERIYKIDYKSGELIKNFGNNGFINIFTKSAPIINDNQLCVAQLFPAQIKCYDKKSGKFIFKVDIHPQDKNFKDGGTIWSNIAFDYEAKIIYLVTGNPRPALIGINRKGKNLNSNSVIAVDLKKKN